MSGSGADRAFAGSLPSAYQRYLVPLLFEPYAADLVNRLGSRTPRRVLEVAAGTGAVTRELDKVLPDHVSIVATDLNQPMLDQASGVGTRRSVEWRQADAMQLPYQDETFDAVVCQFGVMFFAEKARALSEARRVLRPGGVLLFNVWDRLEKNEFAHTVTGALASVFPEDPPRFLARTPYAYHETAGIEQDLAKGGFTARPEIVTVQARSRAKVAQDVAIGFCHGTPLRNEIEARDASRMDEATDAAAEAIGRLFGSSDVEGKMQAHVVTVAK